jgi:hypothetical protein
MDPLAWYQIALPAAVCVAVAVVAVRVPRYRFALYGFVAIVGYAMLQDQISARLCPEYFTVLHPPIPGLTDPTLLGISWGFLGGWWGGIVIGYVAGLVATLGPSPPLEPRELVRPLTVLVFGVAVVTGLTGFTVWHHANLLGVSLDAGLTGLVPVERHRAVLIVACYHLSAYASATIGGVVLCVWVWAERCRRSKGEPICPTKSSP